MSRLLHEPTIRLRSLGEDRGHASLELVRELFGAARGARRGEEPAAGELAEVHDLARSRELPAAPPPRALMRIGTRRSALALAQAERRRALTARAGLRDRPDGDQRGPAARRGARTSRAGSPSSRTRCCAGRSTSRCTPPRTCLASSPTAWRCSAPRARRRRGRALRGGRAGGAPPGARVGTSSIRRARAAARRARGPRGGGDARQRRHAPAQARRRDSSSMRSCSRAPGCSGWGARPRSGQCSTRSDSCPRPGRASSRSRAAPRTTRAREAVAGDHRRRRFACLLAERALARELEASCHTPLGAHAVPAGDGRLRCAPGSGCPTARRG